MLSRVLDYKLKDEPIIYTLRQEENSALHSHIRGQTRVKHSAFSEELSIRFSDVEWDLEDRIHYGGK